MRLVPLELMWQRVEGTRKHGTLDFDELLYLGEAVVKTYTAGFVAGVADDPERHRYCLCHKLIRGNSLGDWDDVLADLSTGTSVAHLLPAAKELQQELAGRCGPGSWLHEAVTSLHACVRFFVPEAEDLPLKFEGRKWFSQFICLRNKTRGHGAPTEAVKSNLSPELENSLRLVTDRFALFQREWAYVKRNLSGKYNVVALGSYQKAFESLKSNRSSTLVDGVYVDFGQPEPVRVELIDTTLDNIDFFYPNGHFRAKKSEWLSYISGARKEVDATAYLAPATELPKSHTEGGHSMRVVGRCFANLPPRPSDYIRRDELELELSGVLSNDRHPVVTLVGRGGIGKTSLALQVLQQLAESTEDRFLGIVWLSARDIDLLPQGVKLVKPSVLSIKDIAREIVNLLQPSGASERNFDYTDYVAGVLRSYDPGAMLIVFDNFETVQQPLDVFNWLDQNIRPPNKVLITTRHRDFRGDFAVEVGGMTEPQSNQLVRATAAVLGLQSLVTTEFCREVYQESEGHPYVVKVLVGEAVAGGRLRKVERIVASKEEILDALFERTYTRLSPASRRVFLTLCNWRSLVPAVALEAALLRPTVEERIDVSAAVEELRRVSFVDQHVSETDGSAFLSVPVVTAVFGKRKLKVSPDHVEIENDTRFLQRFGGMQPTDLRHGLDPRIKRMFAFLSAELERHKLKLEEEMPILELIARQYPPAWLLIAGLWEESEHDPGSKRSVDAIMRYLETSPPTAEQRTAWQHISDFARRDRDWLGFVNAIVHIAELPGADLESISGVVNTFNSVNRELESDPERRKTFAKRLLAVMEPKILEGDAVDCSRLAWLFLQLGNRRRAWEIVQNGLKLDPQDEHCVGLRVKLDREMQGSPKQPEGV